MTYLCPGCGTPVSKPDRRCVNCAASTRHHARWSDFELGPTGSAWVLLAACRDADPDLFHPIDGTSSESPAVRRAAHLAGKAICNGIAPDAAPCPVRTECLTYALARPERDGVWGGTDPAERAAMMGGAA